MGSGIASPHFPSQPFRVRGATAPALRTPQPALTSTHWTSGIKIARYSRFLIRYLVPESRRGYHSLRFVVCGACARVRSGTFARFALCAPAARSLGETTAMFYRSSIAAAAALWALCVITGGARAWDDSKYPDFSGQ